MAHGLASVGTALGGYGLTWLVQSSALLGLGMLVGSLLKRFGPAVQSGVYRTTLGAVLICPVASALLAAAGFEGLTLRLSSPRADDAAPVLTAIAEPPSNQSSAIVSERSPVSLSTATQPVQTPSNQPLVAPSQSTASLAAPAPISNAADGPGMLAVAAAVVLVTWLLGSAALGLRLLLGEWRMRKLRASAVAAGPDAVALCDQIAERMRVNAPEVMRSPFLFSPCLDGLRRPVILLPEDVCDNLRETFVHQLAHLVRHDGLWNLLRRLATAAFWVQPLLWVLSRRIEASAEEVCDDFVVQFGADRARYAGHLLELAGRALPPTAAAGVGMVSLRSMLARRILRILDSSRLLSTRAGTRAVVAMVIVGFTGTLLAGLVGVGSRESEALARVTEAKPAPKDESVRGQVIGPDGKPVPGAKVTAWRARSRPDQFGRKSQAPGARHYEYVRRIADNEGRFEVAFTSSEADATTTELEEGISIIATAPGSGLGYYLNDQPIRLSAGDQPVSGRLVDLEGRPVAGVSVRIMHVRVPEPEARREADARSGPYEFPFAKSVGLDGEPILPGGVVTDADGRFRIEGLGRDVMMLLELPGPKVAYQRFRVISRAKGPIAAEPHHSGSGGMTLTTTYGADCTVAVQPSRPIEGVVRDIETREPIPGAIVTAHQLSGTHFGIDGLIQTWTDAQGRYRLDGLPKEGAVGHKLAVYPPIDRPYFVTDDIVVPASLGIDHVNHDIALRRATWLTGRVTDIKTGKPVKNALIDYFPMLSNERAKDYPNFDPNITGSVAVNTHHRSDQEGRFRIPALHGRGVVTVRVESGTYRTGFGAEAIEGRSDRDQLLTYDHIYTSMYNGLREVDIPQGSDSFSCDVPLDPGGSLKVRLVDSSGKPVTTAMVTGRLPDSIDLSSDMRGESVARVAGLDPGKSRTLVAQESVRKIGAVLTIPPEGSKDGDEITVTLRPNASVTGRVVNEAGKPAAGYIQVRHIPSVRQLHDEINIADMKVEADGRFRCDDLPPGGSFRVWLINREGSMARVRMKSDAFQPFELAEKLHVEPGQVVDFGTYNVTTGKRIEPPAAQAATADVPITGRIVNLEGQPVAGVSVKIEEFRVPKEDNLTNWLEAVEKGAPPWVAASLIDWNRKPPEKAVREAKTDNNGRFRLEGFGGERILELSLQHGGIAYKRIEVVMRKMNPIPARGFRNQYGPGAETIYGADFVYAGAPSRPIEGVVKDAKTGQLLPGVEVRSSRFAGSNFIGTMSLRTTTDSQGRFRMDGLPKGTGNQLLVVPNDDQPYFLHEVKLPDPSGGGVVLIEVDLHRGIWIEGKLTDQATGKPIPAACLSYLPFLENKFAQAIPEFGEDRNTHGSEFQDRYLSKADGSFRLVGLPGRAIVGAFLVNDKYMTGAGSESIRGMTKAGHFETYGHPIPAGKHWPHVMREIDPPAAADVIHVDLQAVAGDSVRLKVVDADGKPVHGVKTLGMTGRGSYDREALAGSEGKVTNLMPVEERTVMLRHEDRKLGKVVRVRKGDDKNGPVAVMLEPLATMTGRVVDVDATSFAGAIVRPDLLPSGDFSPHLPEVATDETGRFHVRDVPTGCDYALAVDSMGAIKKRRFAFLEKVTVKPGATTDVGEIRFKNN